MTELRKLYLTGTEYESGVSGIDRITNVLETIDYSHHEIHAGSNYRVQANASATSITIAFKTPSGDKLAHFLFEWNAESTGYIDLLEGTTITASTGTDRICRNSRRDAGDTSMLLGYATGAWVANYVTIDPTITGGTVVSNKQVYTDAKQGGSSGERRAEIILAADTEYALKWTSTDGAKGIQLRCEWYEHTDKNI